jgi:hypothetical protein
MALHAGRHTHSLRIGYSCIQAWLRAYSIGFTPALLIRRASRQACRTHIGGHRLLVGSARPTAPTILNGDSRRRGRRVKRKTSMSRELRWRGFPWGGVRFHLATFEPKHFSLTTKTPRHYRKGWIFRPSRLPVAPQGGTELPQDIFGTSCVSKSCCALVPWW